jgi:hypothetical protein
MIDIYGNKPCYSLYSCIKHKKGSSVHVAPACVGSREGSHQFVSYVCSLYSCIKHACHIFPHLLNTPCTHYSAIPSATLKCCLEDEEEMNFVNEEFC